MRSGARAISAFRVTSIIYCAQLAFSSRTCTSALRSFGESGPTSSEALQSHGNGARRSCCRFGACRGPSPGVHGVTDPSAVFEEALSRRSRLGPCMPRVSAASVRVGRFLRARGSSHVDEVDAIAASLVRGSHPWTFVTRRVPVSCDMSLSYTEAQCLENCGGSTRPASGGQCRRRERTAW